MELLEHFIVYNRIRKDSPAFQGELASWYLQEDIDVRFRRSIRRMDAALEDAPPLTPEWLMLQHWCSYLNMRFSSLNGPASTASLNQYMEALDNLFVTQKLWTSAELLARSRWASHALDIPLLNLLLDDKDLPLASPLQVAYLQLVRLQQSYSETERLDRFLESLTGLGLDISREAHREMYLHALNGAAVQTNLGNARYRNVYLAVIGAMEDKGLLYDAKGHLEQWIFSNTVLSILREKDPAQARSFMEQHVQALPSKEREPFGRLAAARIAFAEGDYEEVLASSVDLPFKEFKHVIHFRIMSIKALAEIAMRGWKDRGVKERNASKRLDDGLKAFSNYLRYHKLEMPGRRYDSTMNLIRFLTRFWRLPISTRNNPQKLLLEAEKATVAEKDWLLGYMRQDGEAAPA